MEKENMHKAFTVLAAMFILPTLAFIGLMPLDIGTRMVDLGVASIFIAINYRIEMADKKPKKWKDILFILTQVTIGTIAICSLIVPAYNFPYILAAICIISLMFIILKCQIIYRNNSNKEK